MIHPPDRAIAASTPLGQVDGVTDRPIRLGLVGCGGIASAHGRAAQAAGILGRASFVACCDIAQDAARAWADQFSPGAAVHTDLGAMLRSARLDGILLATWPNLHRQQILTCIDAGIRHILCEKALVTTGKEAMEVWHAAGAAGAMIMEGFMYRHHPAHRRIDAIIAAGAIGQVDNVHAAFGWYAIPDQQVPLHDRNWRLRPDCAGGVPYDSMCYAVDACGHLAGALPKRVMAMGTVDHFAQVMLREYGLIEYANGMVGKVSASHGQHYSQELQIEGANGHLHLPIAWTIAGTADLQRRHSPRWASIISDSEVIPAADSYALQLANFIEVMQSRQAPLVRLVDSLINAHVSEALLISARERTSVDVQIPDELIQAHACIDMAAA